uniref:Uncharacterized protein n=1 Tax=Arundo donax TaxID=35708 RepID=A0A0A8YHZ6_ARUDO
MPTINQKPKKSLKSITKFIVLSLYNYQNVQRRSKHTEENLVLIPNTCTNQYTTTFP